MECLPVALPLSLTGGCEREPAQQSGQRSLELTIQDRRRALALIQGTLHPIDQPPDANSEARLGGIDPTTVRTPPDDHGLCRCKWILITARRRNRMAPQHRARGALKALVLDPPFARSGRCPGQHLDDRRERLNARPASRRGGAQLVVVGAADELELALRAGTLAALIFPDRPTTGASRDRQAAGRLHAANIGSMTCSACSSPTAGAIGAHELCGRSRRAEPALAGRRARMPAVQASNGST